MYIFNYRAMTLMYFYFIVINFYLSLTYLLVFAAVKLNFKSGITNYQHAYIKHKFAVTYSSHNQQVPHLCITIIVVIIIIDVFNGHFGFL